MTDAPGTESYTHVTSVFGGRGRAYKTLQNVVKDTFIDPAELMGLKSGEVRQVGHSTHQMQTAPQGALYIWCNGDLAYPISLARSIGRGDLRFVWSGWLDEAHSMHDLQQKIVIDHAFGKLRA